MQAIHRSYPLAGINADVTVALPVGATPLAVKPVGTYSLNGSPRFAVVAKIDPLEMATTDRTFLAVLTNVSSPEFDDSGLTLIDSISLPYGAGTQWQNVALYER